MRVNLGSGTDRMEGFVNLDRAKVPGVDMVHDLDVGPWPFADCSVMDIMAKDVFEHVADPILFMTECWRVLEHRGVLNIRTPHWRHRDAYTDPTHRRFPTEHTFDYWIPGTVLHSLHNKAYGDVDFKLEGPVRVQGGAVEIMLSKIGYKVAA